ncbi:hypothetical protein ACB092_05G048300 [Castanea dentata]
MSEGPKLYTNKPKNAQLKQFQEHQTKTQRVSSPSAMVTHESLAQPPQPPPKESFAQRYKFLYPMLVAVNLAVGAYLFVWTKKKDEHIEEEGATPVSIPTAKTAPIAEKTLHLPSVTKPVKLWEPIPEDKQGELFKWMLEEKRKIKPKDFEEKKCIDEEKAILKQFILAKPIPSI